jgi:hypothetical protein
MTRKQGRGHLIAGVGSSKATVETEKYIIEEGRVNSTADSEIESIWLTLQGETKEYEQALEEIRARYLESVRAIDKDPVTQRYRSERHGIDPVLQ